MQCLSIILLVALVLPVQAGGPSQGKIVYDSWDAAYLQGKRAGYVHTSVEKQTAGAEPTYRTTMKMQLKVKRFNTLIELRMDTGTEETAGGKVTGVFMRQYLGQAKQLDLTGKVVGKQVRLMLDGTKALKPAPWNDAVVGLYRQQTMFRDKMVKPGDTFQFLSFEPSINLVVETNVKIKDYEEVELFGGQKKQRLLRVETTPEKVENVQLPTMLTWLNEHREPVRAETQIPGLGTLTLYRTTKQGALSSGSGAASIDVGLNQLVPLKRFIADPYNVREAVYRITIQGDEDPASALAHDGRQTVKKVQGSTVEVQVRGNAATATAEQVGEEFLQSSYFINSQDAQVKRIARSAVGSETDPWQKALRLERWVNKNMRGRSHEQLATADHVARTLEGDCTEFAMLLAALCRAEGVPSKTAIGLIYANVNNRPAFSFHMWTEVWVRGRWIPLDATLGRGHVGATHLKVTDHSWHETRSLLPLLPVVRVLGKMSIEVVRIVPGQGS